MNSSIIQFKINNNRSGCVFPIGNSIFDCVFYFFLQIVVDTATAFYIYLYIVSFTVTLVTTPIQLGSCQSDKLYNGPYPAKHPAYFRHLVPPSPVLPRTCISKNPRLKNIAIACIILDYVMRYLHILLMILCGYIISYNSNRKIFDFLFVNKSFHLS